MSEAAALMASVSIMPSKWRRALLKDIAVINPPRPPIDRDPTAPTTFVPMSAIDDRLGTISWPTIRPYQEVRKGYTYFAENDVLFAKITPCMQNGKHAIATNLIDGIGFGTTEFHVIRPGPEITGRWVHFFLRQGSILTEAAAHFTGAVGQQRVPEGFLATLEIPVPPLAEQRRIVAMLDRQMALVHRITSAAHDRSQAAWALPQAYLNETFSSPQTERWPKFSLGDKAAIASGVTLGRRLNSETARLVPYLRVANVKDGFLDLQDLKSTLATPAEINALQLRAGDILLTEGGDADKLGRGTYWRGEVPECIHQNHVFRVRLNDPECLPEFVSAQLCSSYGKRYFLAHAKQTTGIATINQRVIRNFPLKVPPLSEQQKIVAVLERKIALMDEIRQSAASAARSIAVTSSALLRQAFREAA